MQLSTWVAAVFLVAAHLIWRDEAFTPTAAMYGGLLGALALLVWAYTPARSVPVRGILFSAFYIAMGAPTFSRPFLASPFMRIRITESGLERATFACLFFALLALATSFAIERLASRWSMRWTHLVAGRVPDHQLPNGLFLSAAMLSVATSVALALIPRGQAALGPLGYPATLLASPALSMTLLMYVSRKTGRSSLLNASLLVLTLAGLGTGMLGNAAIPGVTYCMASWRLRGRVPVALLVALIAGLIGLNSTKHLYRSLTWNRENVGVIERAQNWSTAIERTYGGRGLEAYADGAKSSASRLSTLVQVAQIMDWVPGKIPFAGVDLWLELPLEFIPRAVWPGKPLHAERYNQNYTQTFKIQSRLSIKKGTAVTLPAVGDGYWRASWYGVAAESVLLGILVGTYSALGKAGDLWLILLTMMFAMGTSADQHVFATLAGQPQLLLAMGCLMFLLRRLGGLFSSGTTTPTADECEVAL